MSPVLENGMSWLIRNSRNETGDRLERAFVSALDGHHPLRGGFDPVEVESVKAFTCLAEIKTARVRLKRLVGKISG